MPSRTTTTVGDVLRVNRGRRKLTTTDVGKALGCDASMVSMMERGKRSINTKRLAVWLDVLGMSYSDLDGCES